MPRLPTLMAGSRWAPWSEQSRMTKAVGVKGWSKFEDRADMIDCSRPTSRRVSERPQGMLSPGPEPSVALMAPPSPVEVPSKLMSAKLT
jgi:hypothetical protein